MKLSKLTFNLFPLLTGLSLQRSAVLEGGKGLFKYSVVQDFWVGPNVFIKPLNHMIQHTLEWKAGASGKRWSVIYSVFYKLSYAFQRE